MTPQQDRCVEKLKANLEDRYPTVTTVVTGAVDVYFYGRESGLYWSREYRVSADCSYVEVASRP